mmetsp:Transcript_22745/g.51920  ORF Transcript_22745/g.51920 Transcript_22745/m.51920 type:complete len:111 (+) Transcript_22745:118-450(+)
MLAAFQTPGASQKVPPEAMPCSAFAFTYNEAVDGAVCKNPCLDDWSGCGNSAVDGEQTQQEGVDVLELWTMLGAAPNRPEAHAAEQWVCLRPLPRNWRCWVRQALLDASV